MPAEDLAVTSDVNYGNVVTSADVDVEAREERRRRHRRAHRRSHELLRLFTAAHALAQYHGASDDAHPAVNSDANVGAVDVPVNTRTRWGDFRERLLAPPTHHGHSHHRFRALRHAGRGGGWGTGDAAMPPPPPSAAWKGAVDDLERPADATHYGARDGPRDAGQEALLKHLKDVRNVTYDQFADAAAEVCESGPGVLTVVSLLLIAAIALHAFASKSASKLRRHPWFVARDNERRAVIAAARAAAQGPVVTSDGSSGSSGGASGEMLYRFVPGQGFVPAGVSGTVVAVAASPVAVAAAAPESGGSALVPLQQLRNSAAAFLAAARGRWNGYAMVSGDDSRAGVASAPPVAAAPATASIAPVAAPTLAAAVAVPAPPPGSAYTYAVAPQPQPSAAPPQFYPTFFHAAAPSGDAAARAGAPHVNQYPMI